MEILLGLRRATRPRVTMTAMRARYTERARYAEIVRSAVGLLAERQDAFLHDRSLPLPVRGALNVHMTKPWIPDFWAVAIKSPHEGGDQSYFDFPIARVNGDLWFFPSKKWWVAHATASHPPDGSGCDVEVHTKFLSKEGSVHEFDYATIFLDGRMSILGRRDFAEECAWWRRAFVPNA